MNRGWLRLLVPTIAGVALITCAALVFDWFVVEVTGVREVQRMTLDLRTFRACTLDGTCTVIPMSAIKGAMYPPLGSATFFGSLMFGAIALYQVGSRLIAGFANQTLTKAGLVLGGLVLLCAFGAGYAFAPDLEPGALQNIGIDIDSGLGPSMMLLGLVLGLFGLSGTREPSVTDDPVYKPLTPLEPSITIKKRPPTTPPLDVPRSPTPHKLSTPIPIIPGGLKGKIEFSMVTGMITPAGIDARREDGSSVLVMWRDVVGLVVRRLPPELEGHPFLDIVSTSGMTLRVLPWSRLTGELADVDGAEPRLRALVVHVKPRCPDAALDKPTQAFTYDDKKSPAQLKNLEMLAAHDKALE